jgi:hypothetical protein
MTFDYVASMTQGHTYNEYVADVLRSFNIDCSVPELEIAKTKKDISRMTVNEKDIVLGDGRCLEVKSRNLVFNDDPISFPYNDLLVDTVSGYEAKAIKPLAYIFVSQKTKRMFALPTYTHSFWKIQKKYDHHRKHEDKFYLATVDLCRPFSALIQHLKSGGN